MQEAKSEELKDKNQIKRSKLELKYRAFYFGLRIIKVIERFDQKRLSIKIISDQLIRAATSIGANIIEAKGSSSKKEFVNYFHIALKSAQETKYWLAYLKELLPADRDELKDLIWEAEEITKIISASILTMKGKRQL